MTEVHYLDRPDNRDLRQIPGDYGLPLIGNALSLAANPLKFCDDRFHRYGEISRFAMGPSHIVLALGPDNARALHLDVEKNFSSAKGMGHFESLIGGSLIMKDFEAHRFQRRLMQTAFKKSSMEGYVEHINAICSDTLRPLFGAGEFELAGYVRSTLMNIAAQTFTGVTGHGKESAKLKTAFEDFIDGFTFIFEVNLPGFKYHRSLQAKKYIAGFIQELIADKRHNNDTDILAHFCRDRDENGEYFSDYDIVENNAITYNHVMPGWWTQPHKFDPERFERGEHKQHSYLFYPFGGGAHKCIGMNFAQMVFRIFMFHIIKRHEIQLRPGYDPDLQYLPMPKPKDDLPMRLIPIN